MSYRLQLQYPPNFNKLIENGIKIEEAMVQKSEIKLYSKDNAGSSNSNSNTYNSNSNNDKSKYWNKNKNIVNDGIVDNRNAQSTKPLLNLTSTTNATQATYNNQSANQNTNKNSSKPRLPFMSPRRNFTPLGESLESAL